MPPIAAKKRLHFPLHISDEHPRSAKCTLLNYFLRRVCEFGFPFGEGGGVHDGGDVGGGEESWEECGKRVGKGYVAVGRGPHCCEEGEEGLFENWAC